MKPKFERKSRKHLLQYQLTWYTLYAFNNIVFLLLGYWLGAN